jgi:hypothetical protein
LSLHIDDESFRALGLASRSIDLSVPGSVSAAARRTLDALPAFQSLSMLASWCVDGVQSDIAAALAALPAAEQPVGWRLVPTKRSSVRRSSVRVPKVAAADVSAAAASELVDYCAAATIGATAVIGIVSEGGADCRWRLPSALPVLAGSQSVDVHTLSAGLLHPRQVVALVERVRRRAVGVSDGSRRAGRRGAQPRRRVVYRRRRARANRRVRSTRVSEAVHFLPGVHD